MDGHNATDMEGTVAALRYNGKIAGVYYVSTVVCVQRGTKTQCCGGGVVLVNAADRHDWRDDER